MYEVKVPRFGLTMEKGYIERWLKNEGEFINKGDSILEVSSDKITNEVASPVSGTLLKILGQEGEEYPVGQVIALIGQKNEKIPVENSPKEEPKDSFSKQSEDAQLKIKPSGPVIQANLKASPFAKRLAKEYGIPLSRVQGSGPGGRITKQDILSSVKKQKIEDFKLVELSGIRKTIIERLSQSFHQAITLTNSTEVDFTRLRKQTKPLGISITTGIIFYLCKVLSSYKRFNSHFENGELKEYNVVNIGLAVDTERGLIVPVLRNAQMLEMNQIQEKLKDLSRRAREKELKEDELQGSTFTITNLGMMRTDFFTPVLNPPETAILGVGRIVKKPCILDEDKIAIREMAYLSLSYDHRVIDGADAARFLDKLAQYIEKPE